MYQYQVKDVKQVVAGDTFVLELDLGFRVSYQAEVVLANVKTERYGSVGQQGRIFAEEFFKESEGPFVVQIGKDRKDNYEAQVFNAAGDDLGDLLVDAKLGSQIGS